MLRDDINNAVKDAMRAKDERKLSTLRMVNSTIKNADIAARGEGKPPLTDADLLGVFQKMIKQRQESVELYDKGGRAELAEQEREEIAIISAYLPKQMSEADVKAAISAAVAETNAAGMKDMGKVIGGAESEIRRPDGFRQGQRPGEGGAFLLTFRRLQKCGGLRALAGTGLQAPTTESSGKRPSFLLSSGHDDRDHRTRADSTKAKRPGRVDRCSHRRRDLPDPAQARERRSGRLAVVFLD